MTPSARENLRQMIDDVCENVRRAGAAMREPYVGPDEITTASTCCARAETLLTGIRWALFTILKGEDYALPSDPRQTDAE